MALMAPQNPDQIRQPMVPDPRFLRELGSYSVEKAAVLKQAAAEIADDGIVVHVMDPGSPSDAAVFATMMAQNEVVRSDNPRSANRL